MYNHTLKSLNSCHVKRDLKLKVVYYCINEQQNASAIHKLPARPELQLRGQSRRCRPRVLLDPGRDRPEVRDEPVCDSARDPEHPVGQGRKTENQMGELSDQERLHPETVDIRVMLY